MLSRETFAVRVGNQADHYRIPRALTARCGTVEQLAAVTLDALQSTVQHYVRLIHLTDPHLTSLDAWRPGLRAGKRWLSWLSWQRRRRQRHRRHRLTALTQHLKTIDPDGWAITGDLCQIGLAQEVGDAASWLAELAPPNKALLVPGNHDNFALDSEARIMELWAEYLHVSTGAPEWPVVRMHGEVALIGLNSAVVTPVLQASGRLGADVRERLGKTLSKHRGHCRVVLIHHPPTPGACKRRKALTDDRELSDLLAEHGAAMVLHGHLHHNREYCIATRDGNSIPVFCTASASAAGRQGAAAARVFDIEPESGGFRIDMSLEVLDGCDRPHTIEKREWRSAG